MVSDRTAPDHENTIRILCDTITKKGRRVGDMPIMSITPQGADKLYKTIYNDPNGARPRQAEKVVSIARRGWKVVRRLHPELFPSDEKVANPWVGVEMKRRTHAIKPAATREQVYTFAWGAVNAGSPEVGAAAVICFEWLQRPRTCSPAR